MQIVSYGSTFNVGNIFVPDVYLEVVPPESYFGGVATAVAFDVGTADWGPLDTPIALSDPSGIIRAFGGIGPAALTDAHDLCTDLAQALNQAQGSAGLIIYGCRHSDGTDVKATVGLVDTSVVPQPGITINAIYSGTKANSNAPGGGIRIILAAGTATGTISATVVPFAGGGQVEIYPNLAGSGALFWTALQSAINNGLSPARGPSKLVTATGAASTALTPALGTFGLSAGTSGRGVTTAQLLGSEAAAPTGIFTAAQTLFPVSVLWASGMTDTTGAPTLQGFCDKYNVFGLFAFPSGTDVPTAVTTKATLGIYDYQIGILKDWFYWFDTINNQVRLVPPYGSAGGRIAALAPWESPLDKVVIGILGTERNSIISGNQPYSYAELAQLGKAGIMVVTNPVPAGNVFAFRNGYNSVGNNDATAYVEYSRTTNFLAQTIGSILGPFIGKLQGFKAADPLRQKIKAALNTFLGDLESQFFIGDFNVQCDLVNNTNASIAQHLLRVAVAVQYLPSVQVIFTQLQGGTTVQVTSNQPGQSLAA